MIQKTGILLVNLGTPLSPNPKDVHRYLTEFLTDRRVLDLPWLQTQLLVRGLIIPSRYKSSAKSYQEIWTKEGSPLLIHSKNLQSALQSSLGEHFIVELGMRYQHPSIEFALNKILESSVSELIIVPLFPQYASATTGSIHQKVMEILSKRQVIPKVTFIDHYFDHPAFIDAFCEIAKKEVYQNFDHILFSFHGLPLRHLQKANNQRHCLQSENCCRTLCPSNSHCYSAQCYATAHAIAKKLNVPKEIYSISFQSRLGKEPWLEPYTSQTILDLAKKEKKRVLVFSPSFVCDCLETLHEIGIEYSEEFKKAGGDELILVEGLNNSSAWVKGLQEIIHSHGKHDGK